MSTSSSPAPGEVEREADTLASLIAGHAKALRAAALGPEFTLAGATFRLHGKARNTVYRITAGGQWFLKMPRVAGGGAIVRERLGAEIVGRALDGRPGYAAPGAVRVSDDPAFVLTARIPGEPFNRLLFTTGWWPGRSAHRALTRSFETLGRLLAILHARAALPSNLPPSTTRPFDKVAELLAGLNATNATTAAIAAWHAAGAGADDARTFVHGNLRLDNVLVASGRLGLIDFENCGSGPGNQDLSRPITELAIIRCVVIWPHDRMGQHVEALLRGYREVQPLDPRALAQHVSARVARYYLENFQRGPMQTRVGGVPVSRARLETLTRAAMSGHLETVLPQLRL
jgi:Ser/Thr protein kinase RdoA (MazF antagonist)